MLEPGTYVLNRRSEMNTGFYSYSVCFVDICSLNRSVFLSHIWFDLAG